MKIFVIGDSISIHYGPYLEKYLKGIAEYDRKAGTDKALENLDIAQGANGGDSSAVLEYLEARAKKSKIETDYILVNCGLHDIKTNPQTGEKQVPIKEYEENLKNIVKTTKQMGIKLIWIRTTPADEEVHNQKLNLSFQRFKADCIAYNEVADKIMSNESIPSIDLYTFTNNLCDDLYCDHIHFQEHIREKQASFIAGYLNSIITAI